MQISATISLKKRVGAEQFMHYDPFGEPHIDFNWMGLNYSEPYRFTGYEYDAGNDTKAEYAFDPVMWRLTEQKLTNTAQNTVLLKKYYKYENAGNVVYQNDFYNFAGAGYDIDHSYRYDNDYRLEHADAGSNRTVDYTLDMQYGAAGQILNKSLNSNSMKNGRVTNINYTDQYKYSSGNPYAVTGTSSGAYFCWDDAGNMTGLFDKQSSNLYYWTEDNRMQALVTDKTPAFYRYDAGGERELKLLAHVEDAGTNGRSFMQPVYDNAVLYAGELMTVDKSGYKKHYFVEGERILTGIGGGGNSAIQYYTELNTITGEHPKILSEQYFYGYVSPYFTEHENNCNNNPLPAEADMRDVPDLQQSFKYALAQNVRDIQYYWLADRIGSGSVVTNSSGNPVHVLANIPFGETLLDLSSAFETPYQYAGYEYDQESGLEYAHARYYAGMKRYNSFLSTDPMWWKYPSLNAYHYSMNQPITLRDPSGMDVEGVTGSDAKKIVEDIHSVLSADKFAGVRALIKRDKTFFGLFKSKSLAKIDGAALSSALNGVTMSDDESAYIDIVTSAINSNDVHKVEYLNYSDDVSSIGSAAITKSYNDIGITINSDIIWKASQIANQYGEGATVPTKNGSHSLIINGVPNLEAVPRAVTSGHEAFGHGIPIVRGMSEAANNANAVRTDNLIRRLLGVPQRTGSDHGGYNQGHITNPYQLPVTK